MQREKLSNGLILYYEKVPNVNTIALGIGVRVGSIYEEAEKRGISHLLEHMMFKSNYKYSAEEINKIFEFGGIVNGSTSRRFTAYYFEIIRRKYTKALDALYAMLDNKRYKEEEFKTEKKVVLTEITKYKEDPNSWIYDLGVLSLFGRSDLGDPIGGYPETVKNITKQDIEEFKEAYYSPKNMIAILLGNFEEEELNLTMEKLEQLEGDKVKLKSPSRGEIQNLVENRGSEQYYYARAFENVNLEYHKLVINEYLLTVGLSSLLYTELREKRGIGYSIDSWPDLDFFEIVVNGYVKEKHNELLEVIDRIWDLEVSEELIEGKKAQLEFILSKIKTNLFRRVYEEIHYRMLGYNGLEDFKNKIMNEKWKLYKLNKYSEALIK